MIIRPAKIYYTAITRAVTQGAGTNIKFFQNETLKGSKRQKSGAKYSPSVWVQHEDAMVVVYNAVVTAGLRVLERRQRLIGGGQGPHGRPGKQSTTAVGRGPGMAERRHEEEVARWQHGGRSVI